MNVTEFFVSWTFVSIVAFQENCKQANFKRVLLMTS